MQVQLQPLQGLSTDSCDRAACRAYWMGLSTSQWPDFAWQDAAVTPPAPPGVPGGGYRHWGNFTGASGRVNPEPDNRGGSQNCGAANSSQAYEAGAYSAWGWGDEECQARLPFLCQAKREWWGGVWRVGCGLCGDARCGAWGCSAGCQCPWQWPAV